MSFHSFLVFPEQVCLKRFQTHQSGCLLVHHTTPGFLQESWEKACWLKLFFALCSSRKVWYEPSGLEVPLKAPPFCTAFRPDRLGLVCFILVLDRNLSPRGCFIPSFLISGLDLMNQ